MKRLCPEKLLAIISPTALTETLTNMLRRKGISGYTLLQTSGVGSSGPRRECSTSTPMSCST